MRVVREYEVTIENHEQVAADLDKLERSLGFEPEGRFLFDLFDTITRYEDNGEPTALYLAKDPVEGHQDFFWTDADWFGPNNKQYYGPVDYNVDEVGVSFR
jgi:hypothetical protein